MSSDYRVLYVDDNRDARELAAAYFNYSDSGCVVTSAESADEALLLIEKEPFDAYVFDYRLPKTSGIELCRYIRQFDADTPILFFSAMARSADISEGIAAGADEYLVKPNDLEKLPLAVKRLLDEKSAVCGRETVVKNRIYSGIY
jgi:DNA-binding response OmpR family regulator